MTDEPTDAERRERLWAAFPPEDQQAIRRIVAVFGRGDGAAGRIGDELVLGLEWRDGLLVLDRHEGALRRAEGKR